MGLPKGQTNNPSGRPKGTPNKVTTDLRNLINDFLNDNWDKLQNDFDSLEPKDRLMFYERLLQYGLPKLQHPQLAGSVGTTKADLLAIFPTAEEIEIMDNGKVDNLIDTLHDKAG